MHRMPLRLKHPSITWNRMKPEPELFEKTLNQENVDEMRDFLTVISYASDNYFKSLDDWAQRRFQDMTNLLLLGDVYSEKKVLDMANQCILRAPMLSEAYALALQIRGGYFFESYRFQEAASDLGTFLQLPDLYVTLSDYCKTKGTLAICHYMMCDYDMANDYIRDYERMKGNLTKSTLSQPPFSKIDSHIQQFAPEMKKVEQIVPLLKTAECCAPYNGFNLSSKIPLCSSACYYSDGSDKNKKKRGVYLKQNVPKASLILVEDPVTRTLNTPYLQCELCFKQSECIYSCTMCHYKTYCSFSCMEVDKPLHQFECLGYMELVILLMDAASLFRMFLRTIDILNDSVFDNAGFKHLRTAAKVLQKIETVIRETKRTDKTPLSWLYSKPDYNQLQGMQYSTLVATAFRLTFFVYMDTELIPLFFSRLHMSNKQKMILVGCIFMRLNCHMLINTMDFQYKYQLNVDVAPGVSLRDEVRRMAGGLKVERKRVAGDVYGYYHLDVEADVVQRCKKLIDDYKLERSTLTILPSPRHAVVCGDIQRIMSTFKDNLIELYHAPEAADFLMLSETADMCTTQTAAKMISARIAELNSAERCDMIHQCAFLFHSNFAQYFLQRNRQNNRVEQVVSLLCTTLTKLNHSCDPNVEIILLDNGFVMGKTLRAIKSGEELLVSHKAHGKLNTRWERKQFFAKRNIECKCKICSRPESDEPVVIRQGVYCSCNPNVVILATDRKCHKCDTTYNNLVLKYRTEIKILQEAVDGIKDTTPFDEKQLYISYMMLYTHAQRSFVPSNEFRIQVELELAKYLALKNLAKQAGDILMATKASFATYEEHFMLPFHFYNDILEIIKIIFHYNVDEKLYSLSKDSLRNLWLYGVDLIETQTYHLKFYEIYNQECCHVTMNYYMFLAWHENMAVHDVQPLADKLRKEGKSQKVQKRMQSMTLPPLVEC